MHELNAIGKPPVVWYLYDTINKFIQQTHTSVYTVNCYEVLMRQAFDGMAWWRQVTPYAQVTEVKRHIAGQQVLGWRMYKHGGHEHPHPYAVSQIQHTERCSYSIDECLIKLPCAKRWKKGIRVHNMLCEVRISKPFKQQHRPKSENRWNHSLDITEMISASQEKRSHHAGSVKCTLTIHSNVTKNGRDAN